MSGDVVIRAEGLGKKYEIGHETEREHYTALRDVVANGARRLLTSVAGALRQGAGPERNAARNSVEDFWALKDVSFEIRRGEVVGFIGRNGAGKSTLLKVLSRITEPTEGRVVIKGRVASLLEVGTGFHPELTGRENIYLNGAILGMTRAEIRRKFDEIVAFAEVERFLDTPVKRFSSGMYVRLAFAVAAHLEPEILVVDEVLAVGDAEFQRRCLGKMQEVSRGGRTVLFVSHNMAAVKSLTGRCIVLNAGEKRFDGPTEQAIDSYIALGSANRVADVPAVSGKGTHTQIKSVALVDDHGAPISTYMSGSPIRLEIEFMTDGTKSLSVEILLSDHTKAKIGLASLHQFQGRTLPEEAGTFLCKIVLEPMHLAAGMYSFDVTTSNVNDTWDHYVPDALQFEVPFSNPAGGAWNFLQSYGYGALAMPFTSEVTFTELAVCGSPVRQGVGG